MQISTLAQLVALVGAVSAAPKAPAAPVEPLNFNDVILIGDDGHKLIKMSEYEVLKSRGLLEEQSPAPAIKQRSKDARGCEESEEVQVTSDTSFLNWDVPVSPVVSAAGGGVSVGVTSGYSISNSVTVTAGVSATIESVLGLTMSVSYAETWTTTESSTITYTVPANEYGLIVSQPMVRRVQGNYIAGCTDSPTTTAFTSDTYDSQSYGDLAWVKGVIRLCNSTEYPVPYCIGTGTHS